MLDLVVVTFQDGSIYNWQRSSSCDISFASLVLKVQEHATEELKLKMETEQAKARVKTMEGDE